MGFTVGLEGSHGAVGILAAAADYEFADAVIVVELAVGILRGEAFVIVVVAVDDDVGSGLEECIPERLHERVVTVLAAGAEQRLVPVSESAAVSGTSEILREPLALGRVGVAPSDLVAFAVDDDDVPGSEIVAVVALFRVAGGGAKIARIAGSAVAVVFVIADSGPCAILEPPPGGTVTIRELLVGTIRIGEVADGEDGAWNLVDELGGGFSTIELAARGDVTGADEDWVGGSGCFRFLLRQCGGRGCHGEGDEYCV